MKMRFRKANLKRAFKMAAQLAGEHLPEILVGSGIASMLVGTGFAIKATVDVVHEVEEIEQETGEELTKTDILKVAAKKAIAPGAFLIAGGIQIVTGMSKQVKKTGMLATMLASSVSELQEYKDAAMDILGPEKQQEIEKAVLTKEVAEKASNYDPDKLILDEDEERCYDKLTGRTFIATRGQIVAAINRLNWRMTRGGEPYESYNDYCYEINGETRPNNLPEISPLGDNLGWNPEWGMIEPRFDSVLDKYGRPCLCVMFEKMPKYGYQQFC